MTGGEGVALLPTSSVRDAELFVAIDVGRRDQGDRLVRFASAIREDWLPLHTETELSFDVDAVRARSVTRYRDLPLASHPRKADRQAAGAVLAIHAADQVSEVQPEHREWAELCARIGSLHHWFGEDWPAIDDALLVALLPDLCAGLRSFAELRRADWVGALRSHIGWKRWSDLDKLAPERIGVPSGSNIGLRYTAGEPPSLPVRMQEMFGLKTTPTVAGGRVRVRLELLAPNQRPQQITDDLAGFWERTWPEIRKQLRGRYPKHDWPEDPANAVALSRPNRRRKK
jgi:ATP-dependent helicase HrpB